MSARFSATPVRWGILGPGNIAREFFKGASQSPSAQVVAIGARDPTRANLAQNFPGTEVLTGYDALICHPDIDAVYIATPNNLHAEWALKAARLGKHVLCEKPIARTSAEAETMFAEANKQGTFMAEAFMYRLHPLTHRIIDIVQSGRIGELRLIRSSFGFAAPFADSKHRLFNPAMGGGAILDVGGYPVSMARLIAGHGSKSGIANPIGIKASGHIGATGVDEVASILLAFAEGVVADLSVSITVQQDNVLHVMGSRGRLEIDDFWFGCGKSGGTNCIRFYSNDGSREDILVTDNRALFSFEVEAASQAIASGLTSFQWPGMSISDSLANLRVLDEWRRQIDFST